jgi:hypothetical protein
MTPIPDTLTFAVLVTAAGAGIAGVIITTLVQLIKTVLPAIDARVSGALLAFVLSAILYLVAGIATGVSTFDAGLNVFVSWLTCAVASVGAYATITHVNAQRANPPAG